jgi:glycosyltransferase involved in cell wall biosynthesis
MNNKIWYVYPIYKKISFNVISSNHIKHLKGNSRDIKKQNIEIQEIDWSELTTVSFDNDTGVLLHPILYPFGSPSQFGQYARSFSRLLDSKCKIGGFDVSDSDKVSKFSVEILNKLDLIMVPSNWSRNAYINSGVKSSVEVLPHGIPDEFLDDNIVNTFNSDIINLRKRKENGDILILYFMLHSPYRKGADLVTEVMKRIQNKFKNVYLVVKSPGVLARECPGINGTGLRDWMSTNDIKTLYDSCDICICPSRGGGFELNALEAVSRGLPTLVPNGGCFLDYIDYLAPIDLNNKVIKLFTGNQIHTGNGFEIDIDDFERKLVDVISNLEEYKIQFRKNAIDVRNKLSWRSTIKILEEYLEKYEFIS